MYGVKRTTVYLPDELKARLEMQARLERRTEADIIRESLDTALAARVRPKPRIPLGTLGDSTVAERVEELLAEGFGQD